MATPAQKLVKECDLINARRLDTFTIGSALTTDVNGVTTGADLSGTTDASQVVLNMIVETVALHGQPVHIELTSATSMTVSVEHDKSWATAADLQAALNAAYGSAEFTVAAV